MVQRVVCTVAFAVSVTAAEASIDFNPVKGERVLDGIKFEQLIFQGEDGKVIYEQPRGWRYSGSPSRITFTPPNVSQAEAVIEQTPLEKPQNFDEETLKTLQAQVVASAGPASQNVTVVSVEKNPMLLNGHETFEVIVSYQISGLEYQRSVLFLNLPNNQLRFRLVSRKQDFEKLHKAFYGSLNSIQGLK